MSPCELADENVVAETSFLNNLDRLTVDILHVLCEVKELPSVKNKKEMLKGQASKHVNYIDNRFINHNEKDRLGEERRYLILKKFLEKSLQVTLAKALGKMKQSLYVIGNKVEKNKFWPKIKMDRSRDQYESDK
ncbi:4363_t:CDS:2 [Cetraspora pellucida]|uniref:4363_t:CDS:1 n=1 Tax=Cetraspora pellucida TaxID=1433469 RepID=A0A9N9CFF1_9GLOM|nr:4363_t:CDS:2 [Cetraspora pellucida]